MVRHTAQHPKLWEKSFIATNMHPQHRLQFGGLVKKVESCLQGGDSFKVEGPVDKFNLLPEFWIGMEPAEREKVVSIIRTHKLEARAKCQCGSSLKASAYLAVHMCPEQHILFDPTPEDLAIRNIPKDAVGGGATKRIAQRKLDATGGINAY